MALVHHLDHFVLTVKDIEATCSFYSTVLEMEIIEFKGRKALRYGNSKINLHAYGHEFLPKAATPTPGSADLCFLTHMPLERFCAHLKQHAIDILEGPIERTGAMSALLSVYFRDPDGNLIEVSNALN